MADWFWILINFIVAWFASSEPVKPGETIKVLSFSKTCPRRFMSKTRLPHNNISLKYNLSNNWKALENFFVRHLYLKVIKTPTLYYQWTAKSHLLLLLYNRKCFCPISTWIEKKCNITTFNKHIIPKMDSQKLWRTVNLIFCPLSYSIPDILNKIVNVMYLTSMIKIEIAKKN